MPLRLSLLALGVAFLGGLGAAQTTPASAGGNADVLMKEKDFQSEDELRKNFPLSDFITDFSNKTASPDTGVNIAFSFLRNKKILGTLPEFGTSHNVATVEPCAMIAPHVHPRGTETVYMIEGEMLWGLVEENGGREGSAVIKVGQSITFPQGLMHFGQNLSCKQALRIAFFSHRDPGAQSIMPNFFKLPMSAIRQTLGVDGATIDKVSKAVAGPPGIDPECAKRCGLKYTPY